MKLVKIPGYRYINPENVSEVFLKDNDMNTHIKMKDGTILKVFPDHGDDKYQALERTVKLLCSTK